MKLTKYEHACLVLEIDNHTLVVDPGVFSESLPALTNVVAIVVTHAHPDHLDKPRIEAILKANPQAQIFSTAEGSTELGNSVTVPELATDYQAGPFKLEFFGGMHAIVHSKIPQVQNFGVMINDKVYHPGDSFNLPNKPVDVLAAPVSGPWMKLGEAIDFVEAVKPRLVFGTHNVLLSEPGLGIVDNLFGLVSTSDTAYQRLRTGESIDIS